MVDTLRVKPKTAAPLQSRSSPANAMLWSAGALGIIATAVAAILPVLVGVWQSQGGLRADQAGLVAAVELFAQVVGTGVFLWAAPRWALRAMATAGLTVMIIGNLATAVSVDFTSFLLSRGVGGVGNGFVRALCMMCLAQALSPGRAFAVYAAAQLGLAAVTTAIIPHLIDSLGARAPFLALTLVAVMGFALCPFLPKDQAASRRGNRSGVASNPWPAILAIAALFIYFVGQGALWTYLAPVGVQQSISAAGISHALTFLNIAGLAGALGVGALANRVDHRVALLTLLATEILSIASLFSAHSSAVFMASAAGFYFSWCASVPFQFTVISRSDAGGRAGALVPAADGLGLAGGAALASFVLPMLGLGSAGWICGAASVAGVGLYVLSATLSESSTQRLRRTVDAAAAATSEG